MDIDLHTFSSLVASIPENYENTTLMLSRALNKQGISLAGMGDVEPVQTSAEDNREIRRALCEALLDSGKCQGDMLNRVMKRLGFGKGAAQGVMDQSLTCGEVKNILAEVDAEPMRQANKADRKNFLAELEKGGFLDTPEVKTEIQNRLGLQQGGDATAPLTDLQRIELRSYCLNAIKTRMLGTDMADNFIGSMRVAGLSVENMEKFTQAFINAKTKADVIGLVTKVNDAILDAPEVCEDAENRLAELRLATGKDFSSQRQKIVSMLLHSMALRYTSTTCEKMETIASLKSAFNAKLEKWCNAKAAMCVDFEAIKPSLGTKSQNMLLDVIMNIKFKNANDFKQVVNHRTFGHSMLNLLQQQNVTEEALLREMKNMQAGRTAFGQSAMSPHVLAGEEFGHDDRRALSDLHVKFARQCWLDEHGFENISQPWGNTLETFKKIGFVFSKLGDKIMFDGPSATDKSHRQLVMPETIIDYEKAPNQAAQMSEIVKDINYFYFPKDCSIFNEDGEVKGMENTTEISQELSPAMLKYLNEEGGFGIKHTLEDGEFTQYTSVSLDDIVMKELLEDVKIGNSSKEMDDNAIWFQYSLDLRRDSYGCDININGQTYHNASYEKVKGETEIVERTKISSDLGKVFAADPVNGKKAARIISRIVHQGFNALVTANMPKLGEPIDGILNFLTGQNFHSKIDRQNDGSYTIELTDKFHFGMSMDENTGAMTNFTNDNYIQTKHKYRLSFDENGVGTLTQVGRCEMKGYVKKLALTLEEQQSLQRHLDGYKANTFSQMRAMLFNEPTLLNSPELKQKLMACDAAGRETLAAMRKDLYDFVADHVINLEHQTMLQAAGIPKSVFTLLSGGGTDALHRQIFDSLADTTNKQRRDDAVNTIRTLLAGLKSNGIIDTVPEMDTRFMALHHKVHLLGKGENFNVSDMGMITKYLRENKADGDRLLEQLNSENPVNVNVAVAELKGKLLELRKQQGLQLLILQYGCPSDHLEAFQARRNVADFQEHLEHIYAQDDQMDNSLKVVLREVEVAFKENPAH